MKSLLTALLFVGTGSSLSLQAQPKSAAAATVAGRVSLQGEAAAGLTVVLKPTSQTPAPVSKELRARTDGDGRFLFTGVAAGRYVIYTATAAYVSADDLPFGNGRATVNVAEGENVTGLEVKLARGGVITGRITDAQGEPVVEAQIVLQRLAADGRVQNYVAIGTDFNMFRTDDRGVYRIYGLPPGRYRVSVGFAPNATATTQGRPAYPRTFYPGTPSEAEAQIINVEFESEAREIDIRLPDATATYAIRGRVVEAESGQPVAGVEVAYSIIQPTGPSRLAFASYDNPRTNAQGEFVLTGVVPGHYGVFARLQSPSDVYSEPVIRDVTTGDVNSLEIKLKRGGSISGTAIIEGLRDPQILAELAKSDISLFNYGPDLVAPTQGSHRINADGSFAIKGLTPGRKELLPERLPRGVQLARIERGGVPQPNHIIDLRAGEQINDVRLVFSYGTLTQRGEVKVVAGALPAGLRLYVQLRRDGTQAVTQAEVDARGQFVATPLAPGNYTVRVAPFTQVFSGQLDPAIRRAVETATFRAAIFTDNPPPLTLTIDLGQKERAQ